MIAGTHHRGQPRSWIPPRGQRHCVPGGGSARYARKTSTINADHKSSLFRFQFFKLTFENGAQIFASEHAHDRKSWSSRLGRPSLGRNSRRLQRIPQCLQKNPHIIPRYKPHNSPIISPKKLPISHVSKSWKQNGQEKNKTSSGRARGIA